MNKAPASPLGEVVRLFLRLGATAFGGPAAYIAMMEDETVRRRQWLSRERFLDLLGATNLIPGPNATEMACHLGFVRAGWPGLWLGGLCFTLPAALIVAVIASIYVRWGALPSFAAVLYGIKPVIIALILQALWSMGKTALKRPLLWGVCVAAATANLLGLNEIALLLIGGTTTGLWRGLARDRAQNAPALLTMLAVAAAIGALILFASPFSRSPVGAANAVSQAAPPGSTAPLPFSHGALFLFFLKVGAILYGTGYVLLAFLQSDLVTNWQWLSASQLLDATAVGQVTPGPLLTTATFIGYVLGHPSGGVAGALWGATVGTVGVFLPGFVFVALSGPLIPRLRQSIVAGAFLDGVIAASLALMAVVTWRLGREAITDVPTALLALGAAVALFRFRVNSMWLVLGGAVAGLALKAALGA